VKELRHFLGMVQYYRDMWAKRSEMLASLSDLVGECGETKTSRKNKVNMKPGHWDSIHQIAFDNVKSTITKERLYTHYNRERIKPQPKKVQAILALNPPHNMKELRHFLGMVQYYRDMWVKRIEMLASLSDLVGECGETKTSRQNKVKKKPGHWDSIHQIAAVITQENRPIMFFSRKLSGVQSKYTITKLELLAIVETLKEFNGMLWGQRINVYTDHKNLT